MAATPVVESGVQSVERSMSVMVVYASLADLRSHNSLGTEVVVKLFPFRYTSESLVRLPISVGIEPESTLFDMSSVRNCDHFPSMVLIVPLMLDP